MHRLCRMQTAEAPLPLPTYIRQNFGQGSLRRTHSIPLLKPALLGPRIDHPRIPPLLTCHHPQNRGVHKRPSRSPALASHYVRPSLGPEELPVTYPPHIDATVTSLLVSMVAGNDTVAWDRYAALREQGHHAYLTNTIFIRLLAYFIPSLPRQLRMVDLLVLPARAVDPKVKYQEQIDRPQWLPVRVFPADVLSPRKQEQARILVGDWLNRGNLPDPDCKERALSLAGPGYQLGLTEYRVMTLALCQFQLLAEAQKLITAMEKRGVNPGLPVLAPLLAVCLHQLDSHAAEWAMKRITKNEPFPNKYSIVTMIQIHARLGRLSEAQAYLDQLQWRGYKTDIIPYLELLKAYSNAGKVDQMVGLIEKVQRHGISSVDDHYTIAQAYITAGQLEAATKYIRNLIRCHIRPTVPLLVSFLEACARRQYTALAEKILDHLLRAKIPRHTVVRVAMARVYWAAGKPTQALQLMNQLKRGDVAKTPLHWQVLIPACFEMTLWKIASRLIYALKNHTVLLNNRSTYELVLSQCEKYGRFRIIPVLWEVFNTSALQQDAGLLGLFVRALAEAPDYAQVEVVVKRLATVPNGSGTNAVALNQVMSAYMTLEQYDRVWELYTQTDTKSPERPRPLDEISHSIALTSSRKAGNLNRVHQVWATMEQRQVPHRIRHFCERMLAAAQADHKSEVRRIYLALTEKRLVPDIRQWAQILTALAKIHDAKQMVQAHVYCLKCHHGDGIAPDTYIHTLLMQECIRMDAVKPFISLLALRNARRCVPKPSQLPRIAAFIIHHQIWDSLKWFHQDCLPPAGQWDMDIYREMYQILESNPKTADLIPLLESSVTSTDKAKPAPPATSTDTAAPSSTLALESTGTESQISDGRPSRDLLEEDETSLPLASTSAYHTFTDSLRRISSAEQLNEAMSTLRTLVQTSNGADSVLFYVVLVTLHRLQQFSHVSELFQLWTPLNRTDTQATKVNVLFLLAFAQTRNRREANKLLNHLLSGSNQLELSVWNTIIQAQGILEGFPGAMDLFDNFVRPQGNFDNVTLEKLLAAAVSAAMTKPPPTELEAMGKLVEELYRHWSEAKLPAESTVITRFITAFCLANCAKQARHLLASHRQILIYDPQPANIASLLWSFSQIPDERITVEQLCQRALRPNASLLFSDDSMIQLIAVGRRYPEAYEWDRLFEEFLRRGPLASTLPEKGTNPKVVNSMLSYLSQTKRFETFHRVLEFLKDIEFEPDVYTYATMIHGHCYQGDLAAALRVFDRLKSDASLTPNLVVFNTLIHVCANVGKYEQAQKLRADMRHYDINPDHFTYTALLTGALRAGRYQEAYDLVQHLTLALDQNHIQLDDVLSMTAIQACYRAGQATSAFKMAERSIQQLNSIRAAAFTMLVKLIRNPIDRPILAQISGWLEANQVTHPDAVLEAELLAAHGRTGQYDMVHTLWASWW
ncbi:hypothetical protein BJ085DRAFT_38897, partial [Dimargaris cristalligena]